MSPRVEAIEASEFAIAFASYIEGDTGLLIILIVMAEPAAAKRSLDALELAGCSEGAQGPFELGMPFHSVGFTCFRCVFRSGLSFCFSCVGSIYQNRDPLLWPSDALATRHVH